MKQRAPAWLARRKGVLECASHPRALHEPNGTHPQPRGRLAPARRKRLGVRQPCWRATRSGAAALWWHQFRRRCGSMAPALQKAARGALASQPRAPHQPDGTHPQPRGRLAPPRRKRLGVRQPCWRGARALRARQPLDGDHFGRWPADQSLWPAPAVRARGSMAPALQKAARAERSPSTRGLRISPTVPTHNRGDDWRRRRQRRGSTAPARQKAPPREHGAHTPKLPHPG